MRHAVNLLTGLRSMFIGLGVTLKNMVRPKVTLRYPDEKWDLPAGFRGGFVLFRNEDDTLKCTGCTLCEQVCPPRAIYGIEGEKHEKVRVANSFYIDLLRCMYCHLCVEVCPFDAIGMTDGFELAQYERGKTVVDLNDLSGDRERAIKMKGALSTPAWLIKDGQKVMPHFAGATWELEQKMAKAKAAAAAKAKTAAAAKAAETAAPAASAESGGAGKSA